MKRNNSLQVLRTLAFLGVFLCHAAVKIQWAKLSVSIFFVMSGFLMCNAYHDKEVDYSLTGSVKFAITKIRKLYPLHVIATLAMFFVICVMDFLGGSGGSIFLSEIINVILNLLLIQSFVPGRTVTLNGVSWYLSTALFLYMSFPIVHRTLGRKTSVKKSVIACAVVLVLDFIVTVCMPSYSIYEWFTYSFPLYRVGEFVIGYSLRNIVGESKKEQNMALATIFEIIVFSISICAVVYINQIRSVINNASLVFLVPACLLIYIFNNNSGLITKVLCNRVLIYLGNISAYMFLIHAVIMTYVRDIFFLWSNANIIPENYKTFVRWFDTNVGMICCLILEFALTVIASEIYVRFIKKDVTHR